MKVFPQTRDLAPSWAKEECSIYNITMTNANTQYHQVLPDGCKSFAISIQDGNAGQYLRVAFVTGKVATPIVPYCQIPATAEYSETDLILISKTIYFASSEAGKVAQIVVWL